MGRVRLWPLTSASVPPSRSTGDALADFVATQVVPREQHAFREGVTDALRVELQALARSAGVWAPQAPAEVGGGGFRFDEVAVLLEEAGYSLLGPLATNCAAPDEGNMHLLHVVGSPMQREKYLRPLATGDVRSCFSMTEPPPGAGSDPAALRTVARRVDGGWVVDGDKWLITGADGAAFSIVMARTTGRTHRGATMFLVDADNPGFVVGEHLSTIDATGVGGHCRVTLRELLRARRPRPRRAGAGLPGRAGAAGPRSAHPLHALAGRGAPSPRHRARAGRGARAVRLGAERPRHGAGAHRRERDRPRRRPVGAVARGLGRRGGSRSTEESSRAKVFVSEAVCRVVDRSVQLAGGMGTSEELVLGRIYRDIRSFRIYDGATEVHKMSIARRAARRAAERVAARTAEPGA